MKNFLAATFLAVLVGCGSTNNYPTSVPEQIEFHIKYASEYAEQKQFDRVAYHVSELMDKTGGALKVKALFENDQRLRDGLLGYLCGPVNAIETKQNLVQSMRLVSALENENILNGLPACRTYLNNLAAKSPPGTYLWTIEDDIEVFNSLLVDNEQTKIITTSFDDYSAKNQYMEMADRLAVYADKIEKLGSPSLADAVRHAIQQKYCAAAEKVSDKAVALNLMQSMTALHRKNASVSLHACIKALDQAAARLILDNNSKLTLADNVEGFDSLSTPEKRIERAVNTIALIAANRDEREQKEALTKYLSGLDRESTEYKRIRKYIEDADLPPRVLKELRPFYPELADEKLAEIRTGHAQSTNNLATPQLTSMLEGCASIGDQHKKTACFESVMALSRSSENSTTKAQPYTKFDAINRSATALKSATEVGVSYVQYLSYMQQLAAEVQIVKDMKNNNRHEIDALSMYDKAIEAYQDAHAFWRAWIDFYSRRDNELSYFGGLPIGLTNIGWIVNKYALPTTKADLLGIQVGVPRAAALSTMWRKAEEYIQEANDEI